MGVSGVYVDTHTDKVAKFANHLRKKKSRLDSRLFVYNAALARILQYFLGQ